MNAQAKAAKFFVPEPVCVPVPEYYSFPYQYPQTNVKKNNVMNNIRARARTRARARKILGTQNRSSNFSHFPICVFTNIIADTDKIEK